jgi:hypothetical protein
LPKHGEIALDAARAADQHMVSAGKAASREQFARQSTKPPLHPVTDNRTADLLRDGKADALGGVAVGTIADEQHESRARRAPAGVRREEIRAFTKND